ncbi:MAG: hypothetical protein KDK78_05005, partial [Chlamydiia bacterium]|nr:hypothetical protein [Chlamydiia bacterium]
ILSDPYHKRLSVERYAYGVYAETVYDSNLFDFRHLNPQSQVAWKREILDETAEHTFGLVRNIDDRVIYKEHCAYRDGHCVESRIEAPQGLAVAVQKIYYKSLGDAENAVVLYDRIGQAVMWKVYTVGEDGEFLELVEEHWDMTQTPPPKDLN